MSRYTPNEHDWDDPEFLKWRDRLCTVLDELDEYCDEVRADDHDEEGGSCWDLVNDLAQILTYSTPGNPTKSKGES